MPEGSLRLGYRLALMERNPLQSVKASETIEGRA